MATGISNATIRRLVSSGVGIQNLPAGRSFATIRRVTSDVSGVVSATGAGASTIRRLRSNCTGRVTATGESTATLRRLTSAGSGGIIPIGTSAATINRIVGAATGLVSATGTSAATIGRLRSVNGKRYNVKVESRLIYAGEKRVEMGEVFEFVGYTNFKDTITFNVILKSDYKRYVVEADHNEDEVIINNQAAAGQVQFRQAIVVVPPAGFVGTFFQYLIEKSVPSDGVFNWSGGDITIIPRPQLRGEFFSKSGDLTDGW